MMKFVGASYSCVFVQVTQVRLDIITLILGNELCTFACVNDQGVSQFLYFKEAKSLPTAKTTGAGQKATEKVNKRVTEIIFCGSFFDMNVNIHQCLVCVQLVAKKQ